MERVIAGLVVALILAAGGFVWSTISDELETLKNRKLVCQALTTEEFDPAPTCDAGYTLARWCSGDCNEDDAQVTLCCHHE